MTTQAIVTPIIGANIGEHSTDAKFAPGTVIASTAAKSYTYAKAHAALAAATVVGLAANFDTLPSPAVGYTADIAVPAGSFFWVRKTASPF